ncbi:hypothetical protein [uncultured Tateyamaria sp.]|uniref:hypothetical protein n=1 Tax=uncultured Tateyamaria sp. TaxID=455651 RepID=UPI002609F04D|nr:hypothetical protein [uncultured Tateyamaria sp.]
MTRFRLLITCAALAGCTTPDVTGDIGAAQALIFELHPKLNKQLEPVARADLSAAEQGLINSGKGVLELVNCDLPLDLDAYGLLNDCHLVNAASPLQENVNAYSVLAYVAVLDDYFAALSALAKSDSADAVQAQTAAAFAALAHLGQGRGGALGQLGAAAARNQDVGSRAAGFAANQFRINALRRVVAKADPLIRSGGELAAAYFEGVGSPVAVAHDKMFEAQEQASLASLRGDKPAHRAALDRLKRFHAEFEQAVKSSPATALRTLTRHHALLLKRLTGSPQPEEILQSLTQIDALLSALRTRS